MIQHIMLEENFKNVIYNKLQIILIYTTQKLNNYLPDFGGSSLA